MAIVVDLYCRVSTDPQDDGTSMEEQERAGREYCAKNGLVVGLVHREVWTGYQYRERKKLSLMRERYREGKIQGVVVRTFDRLSRRQAHARFSIGAGRTRRRYPGPSHGARSQ